MIDGLGAGGAERSIAEMLPHLEAARIRSTVVCLFRRHGVESELSPRWDIRHVRETTLAGRIRSVRQIIRREEPDLVHTTLLLSSIVGRFAARGCAPVLTTLVSTPYVPDRVRDPAVRRSWIRMLRAVDGVTSRRLTTHFHAISYAVKQHAVDSLGLPPARITVVHRGRDEDRLGLPSPERRVASRHMLGLDDEDEVLVHLGRQEFPKGHVDLLQAVDRLASVRPRLRVVMAGRPGASSIEIAKAHSRMQHPERVRFLGFRADAPEILAAGDLFVFPSLWEGLGCSLIEAMALGLPIVASDLPAIREVVEEGKSADLVLPRDPVALASSIESLLDDTGRARSYGERGRRIFEERFTLARSARNTIHLYRSLTDGDVARAEADEERP
jgi:glycosyltransferase involved in cell wall biosynthesis